MGLEPANVFSSDRHTSEFICALCGQLASLDSYITKGCSHVFCKECCHSIDTFLTKCPRCKERIQGMGDLQSLDVANPLAYRILGKVRIACPYRHGDDECDWVGNYADFAQHLDTVHKNSPPPPPAPSNQKQQRRSSDASNNQKLRRRKDFNTSDSSSSVSLNNDQNKHHKPLTRTRSLENPQQRNAAIKKSSSGSTLDKPPPTGGMRRRTDFGLKKPDAKEKKERRNSQPSPPKRERTNAKSPKREKKSSTKTSSKTGLDCHRRRPGAGHRPVVHRRSSLSSSGHTKTHVGRRNSVSGQVPNNILSGSSSGLLPNSSNEEEEVTNPDIRLAITSAETHYYNREYESCITLCNDALAIDDKTSMAYQHKGRSQIELGRYDDAVETLTAAAEKIPKSDKIQQYLTHATQLKLTMTRVVNLEASGDFAEIIKCTDRTVGSNKHVLLARARAFVHLNDHESAIDAATKVLSIDTQNLDAFLVRSRAFYLMANLDNALSDCQTAVNIDANNGASVTMYQLLELVVNSFQNLSNLMEAEMYNEAIEVYDTLYDTVKPTIPDSKCELFRKVYRGRAKAHLERGDDYKLALSFILPVLETSPRDIEGWRIKINCLEKLERHRDLANELEEVVMTWGSGNSELAEARQRALKNVELMPEDPPKEKTKDDSKSKDKTKDGKSKEKTKESKSKNPFRRRKHKNGPVMTPDMAASPEILGEMLSSNP